MAIGPKFRWHFSSIAPPFLPSLFLSIRHIIEIHDLTANLLTDLEMCHEIQVEVGLQPIFGEQFQQASLSIEDRACLDISMNGF